LLERVRLAASGLPGPVSLMEVCGTHTVAISRGGLRELLPEKVRLLSGPGCPVCVTAQGFIDAAVGLAESGRATLATYGDMLRVPGSAQPAEVGTARSATSPHSRSLELAKAAGADVRTVYSVLEALELARGSPSRPVVFLAVGFETTAPATAVALQEARATGLTNFFVLDDHKRIVPAMAALTASADVAIDGFIAPGHVSVVIGLAPYEPVARAGRPCVVAGFEPVDVLEAIALLLEMLAGGQSEVRNQYRRAVRPEGNPTARAQLEAVFQVADAEWRGLGFIPESGFALREEFRRFDARAAFAVQVVAAPELPGCRCGQVLRGALEPRQCPLFGHACTPAHPQGPCMVSREGSCGIAHRFGREPSASSPPPAAAPPPPAPKQGGDEG
jgi:hydrogenase expression/formation protein HypD